MANLIILLPDQLTNNISSLDEFDKEHERKILTNSPELVDKIKPETFNYIIAEGDYAGQPAAMKLSETEQGKKIIEIVNEADREPQPKRLKIE